MTHPPSGSQRLGPRSTLAILGALCVGSLLLRYPGEHELGVDSFTIHALAQAVVTQGAALWIASPLSYFGWYPVSYPSGGPFLLSSVSLLGQLPVEASILLFSLLLGLLGILGAFVLAREFRRETSFALSVALLYGFAPRFLDFTLWTASTRNLFMAILPIFVWSLVRLNRKAKPADLVVTIVTFVMLAAAHRLVVLALVIVAAFFVAYILNTAYHLLRIQRPSAVLRAAKLGLTKWAGLTAALVVGLGLLAGTHALDEYSSGELASGTSAMVELFNLGISITRSVGLALPLAVVGLVYATRQKGGMIQQVFVVVSLIGFIPTLVLRQYTGFYILPFLAIIGAYGFFGIWRMLRRRPRLARATVGVVVVGSVVLSSWILGYEITANPPASSETYALSLYVARLNPSGTVVCNDALTASRVAAYANGRVLPSSGSTLGSPGPEVLAQGYYSWSEVSAGLTSISLQNITTDADSFWTVRGVDPVSDYATLMNSPVGNFPQTLAARYHPTYYLEARGTSGSYIGLGGVVYPSALGRSLSSSAYVTFDDGVETLWWIG